MVRRRTRPVLAAFRSRPGGFRVDPNHPPLPLMVTEEEREAYAAFARRLAAGGQLPVADLRLAERLLNASSSQAG